MKYFKLTIKAMVLCFMLTSCLEEDKMRVVEGFVYEDCDQKPVEGLQLSIVGEYNVVMGAPRQLYFGDVSTDKNGYYALIYEPPEAKGLFNGFRRVFYLTQAGEVAMSADFSDHIRQIHYRDISSQHRVVLRLTDTLSNQDTLYLSVKEGEKNNYFVGPFEDGQTFTIEAPIFQISQSTTEFSKKSKTESTSFYWALGWEAFKIVKSTPAYLRDNSIRNVMQKACGQGDDIVIDLREKQND